MEDMHGSETKHIRIAIEAKLHERIKHYCKKTAKPKMKLQDFYSQAVDHFLSHCAEYEIEMLDERIDQLREIRAELQAKMKKEGQEL